jgi:hypothetical protein
MEPRQLEISLKVGIEEVAQRPGLTVTDDLRRHFSDVHDIDAVSFERNLSLQPSLWCILNISEDTNWIRRRVSGMAHYYMVCRHIPVQAY